MSTAGRRAAARPAAGRAGWPVVAAAGLLLVTACGVRSTDVPVDAGPAPTVATCDAPEASDAVSLYLVCGSRVEAVQRPVPADEETGDRVLLANVLLTELQSKPPPQEREAGFTSSVPEELRATEPDTADPERLVRLNQHPEELTAVAKAQIVCTFANFQALSDGTVVTLGGPAADERRTWREYTCATSLRHLPEAVHTISRPH
jgi:hypothetical protein